MSLLDRLEVSNARSSFSASYTDQPFSAASLAAPQPKMPPPITRRS